MSRWKRLQEPLKVKPSEWVALSVIIFPSISIGVFLVARNEVVAFIAALAVESVAVWGLHVHRHRSSSNSRK